MALLNKVQLKELLADNKIDEVLTALRQIAERFDDRQLLNDIIFQSSRYKEFRRQESLDTKSAEDLAIERANILDAILFLIDRIPEVAGASTQTPGSSKRGSILYKIPGTMALNSETECLVRIAFEEILLKEALEAADLESSVIRNNIRIGREMTVELVEPGGAENFKIIPANSDPRMFLDPDDYTEWLFFVTPLREGKHLLVLRVGILEIINETERRKELVFREEIEIVAASPAKSDVQKLEFRKADYAITLAAAEAKDGAAPPGEANAPPPAPAAEPIPQPARNMPQMSPTTTGGGNFPKWDTIQRDMKKMVETMPESKSKGVGCLPVLFFLVCMMVWMLIG